MHDYKLAKTGTLQKDIQNCELQKQIFFLNTSIQNCIKITKNKKIYKFQKNICNKRALDLSIKITFQHKIHFWCKKSKVWKIYCVMLGVVGTNFWVQRYDGLTMVIKYRQVSGSTYLSTRQVSEGQKKCKDQDQKNLRVVNIMCFIFRWIKYFIWWIKNGWLNIITLINTNMWKELYSWCQL